VEPLITGLVLAGGRGSRMGGIDKGLQTHGNLPLARHALQLLQAQTGVPPLFCAINANRHLHTYQAWDVPVWPDTVEGLPGPLAGFLTGLEHCTTPYLLTVPCDSPRFPLDLAQRLLHAINAQEADVAMPKAPQTEGMPGGSVGPTVPQPVFCLMRAHVAPSLAAFLAAGEGKIAKWAQQQGVVWVPFDLAHDDPQAFSNINTLADLASFPAV
jgi:molybdenum cofactor guanylyltransferase